MKNTLECSDLILGGNVFDMTKIDDLSNKQGSFHSCNHGVIFTKIKKTAQGGYKYNKYILLLINIYQIHLT